MAQILPQDLLLAVKLLSQENKWTFESMGEELGISASQCHQAFKRLIRSGLVDEETKFSKKANVLEFLVYSVKYIFPAVPMHSVVKGIPTAHSANLVKDKLVVLDGQKYVWEHPSGKVKGLKIEPIFKTIPEISTRDKNIYSIFSVLDSLRLGKARERKEAANILEELIYAR